MNDPPVATSGGGAAEQRRAELLAASRAATADANAAEDGWEPVARPLLGEDRAFAERQAEFRREEEARKSPKQREAEAAEAKAAVAADARRVAELFGASRLQGGEWKTAEQHAVDEARHVARVWELRRPAITSPRRLDVALITRVRNVVSQQQRPRERRSPSTRSSSVSRGSPRRSAGGDDPADPAPALGRLLLTCGAAS